MCFVHNDITCNTESPLYKVVGGDHALHDSSLGEMREVFIEEVRERGSLANDCELETHLLLFPLHPLFSLVVAMLLEGVAKTHPLMMSPNKECCSFSVPSMAAIKMIIR